MAATVLSASDPDVTPARAALGVLAAMRDSNAGHTEHFLQWRSVMADDYVALGAQTVFNRIAARLGMARVLQFLSLANQMVINHPEIFAGDFNAGVEALTQACGWTFPAQTHETTVTSADQQLTALSGLITAMGVRLSRVKGQPVAAALDEVVSQLRREFLEDEARGGS